MDKEDKEKAYKWVMDRIDFSLKLRGIPHEMKPLHDGYIIAYPSFDKSERKGDVAYHSGTIGLEAYGFGLDDIDSSLRYDEAVDYFVKAYEKDKEENKENMDSDRVEKWFKNLLFEEAEKHEDEDVKSYTFTMKLDGNADCFAETESDEDVKSYTFTVKLADRALLSAETEKDEDDDEDEEDWECTVDAGINIEVGGIRVENLQNVDDAIKILDFLLIKGKELTK